MKTLVKNSKEQAVGCFVRHHWDENRSQSVNLKWNWGGMLVAWLLVMQAAAAGWAALPSAFTQPAVIWDTNTMMLRGVVHPEGEATAVWFEWGPTMEMTSRTAVTVLSPGEGLTWVNEQVSDWQVRHVYYYRLVASNSTGVVRGMIQMFGMGKVVAWGWNGYGQTNVPVELSDVVTMAGGYRHSLALRREGTVVAWGNNEYGQADVPTNLSNVVAVASGWDHNLALRSDGTVVAWGRNDSGQTDLPMDLSNVVAVASGGNHSLALRQDGTVVAWGVNSSGQATVPEGLSNVVALAAGGEYSLALRRDGTVVAWGANWYGQRNVPAGLSNVIAIAAGDRHNLALRREGTVVAWGYNDYGQATVPTNLSDVVAVAAGGHHSLALRRDGTVVAWGQNGLGQTNVPAGLSNVVVLVGGKNHSLALFNIYPMAIPKAISAIRGIDSLVALQGFDENPETLSFRVVALPEAGTLYQCVNGARGEAITFPGTSVTDVGGRLIYVPPAIGSGGLLDGFEFVAHDGLSESAPTRVKIYIDIPVAVFTQSVWPDGENNLILRGAVHPYGLPAAVWFEWGPTMEMENVTVATNLLDGDRLIWVSQPVSGWEPRKTYYYRVVASNSIGVVRGAVQMFGTGQVVCWGGQTNVPVGLSHIAAVSAGGDHSLALRQDGTLVAWGNNSYGQTNVPAGLSNVVTVSAGASHSLALLKDGRVVAWGWNTFAQTRVPSGLSNVVSVAAGAYHSLALQQDGTVRGWGHLVLTNMPPNLSNVVAVAAGSSHSVALRADGTVAAWSLSDYDSYVKAPIGLSNVVAIAAGWYHSLALRRDGTVVAWGLNNFGQTNVPAGLSNVVAIEAGEDHSLALRQDGTVVAWGRNHFGQASVPGSLSNVVAVSGGLGYNLALVMLPPIPPSIVSQPLSRTVRVGEEVTFCVGAQADPEPAYQWWFNGTNLLSEATGPCLMLTNVQPAHAGDYQVVVSNSVGAVTSEVARLTVATVWVGSVGLESGGRLSMALHTPPGRVCELWATTDLALPMSQWTLVTVLTNETGRLEWSAPVGAEPGRFYRIRMP